MKWVIRIIFVIVTIPVTAFLFILLNYFMITISSSGRLGRETEDLPQFAAILVLGAGNSEPGKWVNYTFEHRMEAAKRIFEQDSTALFIASGMIRPPYYDEAADIRERLKTYGVSDQFIVCDTTATRTWISVQNAVALKKQRELVIVSQREHLERALFCASCQNIKATGIVADSPAYEHRFWTYREYLARVKATLDCVVFRLKNQ
jgi:SanA protein